MFWLLMLLTMPADAGKKNKKEPVPPTDHGEVAFNGLSMRAETYKGGTVKTEGVFGGVVPACLGFTDAVGVWSAIAMARSRRSSSSSTPHPTALCGTVFLVPYSGGEDFE